MKKSRIEFIESIHSASEPHWKKQIETEFPKIFQKELELEVGVWYKSPDSKFMICIQTPELNNDDAGFGFGVSGE